MKMYTFYLANNLNSLHFYLFLNPTTAIPAWRRDSAQVLLLQAINTFLLVII